MKSPYKSPIVTSANCQVTLRVIRKKGCLYYQSKCSKEWRFFLTQSVFAFCTISRVLTRRRSVLALDIRVGSCVNTAASWIVFASFCGCAVNGWPENAEPNNWADGAVTVWIDSKGTKQNMYNHAKLLRQDCFNDVCVTAEVFVFNFC